jgi:UDP-N-acetylbacillosamine transaminase
MERLPDILAAKEQIFNWYKEHLGDKLYDKLDSAVKSNYWLVGLKTENKYKLMKHLDKHNIQTRPLWMPNHLQEAFKEYKLDALPNSEKVWQTTVNLPSSINLTKDQIDRICELILEIE